MFECTTEVQHWILERKERQRTRSANISETRKSLQGGFPVMKAPFGGLPEASRYAAGVLTIPFEIYKFLGYIVPFIATSVLLVTPSCQ